MILITLNCIRLIIRYSFQSYFLQRSIYLCRTYKFLTNYFSHCAVWILCTISLERAAVTRRLVLNQTIFNHKHSYCTLIIIYTILFFLNLHYLIFFGSEQEKIYQVTTNQTETLAMCSSNLIRPPKQTYDYFLTFYFSWMDFIINSLIPFIIILIANISVMYSVCQSRIMMKQLGIRQTRSTRDTQLAYILFVSTFLFLLLTFPLRVFSVVEPYLTYEKKYLILADGIMRFLLYLDHGCGFYLYTFTGELFRRELRKFIYQFSFSFCRQRCFNVSSIESRRPSELSCSNGTLGVPFLFYPTPTPINTNPNTIPIKSSSHSFSTNRTFYHQCVYAKYSSINPNKNQFLRTQCVSTIEHPSFSSSTFPSTNFTNSQTGLVKRHSSSCFESQFNTTINSIPLTSNNILSASADLDRKSDII